MMKKTKSFFIVLNIICVMLLALIISSFFVDINDSIIKLTCSAFGLILPLEFQYIQDLTDKMPWQTYLRFLIRKKHIKLDTKIRISFALFFKIRVDDTFLLIPNIYGISEFQIPGYTYHLPNDEKNYLIKEYQISSDNRIVSKEIKDDYRFFISAKHIKNFYKRFESMIDYKNGDYVGTYFKKLFVDNNYLSKEKFNKINYFFVKRDVQPITYSPYLDCYELLLRDVYEIQLNEEQLNYLRELKNKKKAKSIFYFASESEIKTLGVDYTKGKYKAFIGAHTRLLLDDYKGDL